MHTSFDSFRRSVIGRAGKDAFIADDGTRDQLSDYGLNVYTVQADDECIPIRNVSDMSFSGAASNAGDNWRARANAKPVVTTRNKLMV